MIYSSGENGVKSDNTTSGVRVAEDWKPPRAEEARFSQVPRAIDTMENAWKSLVRREGRLGWKQLRV